jgi:glycosyltransferase involved in cell wall biosynthesis
MLSLQTGGLERVVVDLVNCAGPEFQPFVVCLETSGPMEKELRRPNTPVVLLNRKPGFRPWLAVPLSRELRARGAKIVHTHNTAAGFYGALAGRLSRIPVVHTKHGQNLSGGNQRAVNRLAYLLTDHVVAVSESARVLATSEGARRDRLSIIDNGVDIARFANRKGGRAEARQRLAVAEGELVVGTVGRLAAVKNQRLLIESAGDAATKSGQHTTLVIVGDGPERERLATAAQAAPAALRVVLAGAQRAEEWLPAFDVFVLSSDSEGLPIALLEAMACGVPAVVTAVGAVPEVVDHGRAGVLVPPGDRTALAHEIAALGGDAGRRAALTDAGLRCVKERHGAETMARNYEALYRRLLDLTQDSEPSPA